ncbi:MAG: anhydro-N-acetylmuramic acid kinase [Phycisphaerae bacterium]|nr:anhydro-N-acetylmuramic acid kinase [Phycisphaerae bacterium]
MSPRRVIGAMTGTSLDAIDVALVRIAGQRLALRCDVERVGSRPLGELGPRLRAFCEGARLSAAEICALSREFALAHCAAIGELLASAGAGCDLIGIHGQTVFHAPPLSWQLFSPAPVAAEFGCKVICDFRAADIAAGGQGAPLTPIADYVLLGSDHESRVVVNLGGFANHTVLPRRHAAAVNLSDLVRAAEHSGVSPVTSAPIAALMGRRGWGDEHAHPPAAGGAELDAIRGGDICACNHLLDGLARRLLNAPFDRDGAAAERGVARAEIVAQIRGGLEQQAAQRRSLGSGDELRMVIDEVAPAAAANDVLRSAGAALADTIAAAVARDAPDVGRVLLAGGGAANRTLRGELVRAIGACGLRAAVEMTDAHGLPAGHREAIAFAVLADLCDQGVPIALPRITGARRAVVAGSVCAAP